MKENNNSVLVALVVLGIVVFCGAAYSSVAPVRTTEEIEMIQPCGWPWCMGYDAHYAGNVNLPNSEANLNNGQAEVAEARAEEISANDDANRAAFGLTVFGLAFVFLVVMFGGGAVLLLIASKGR